MPFIGVFLFTTTSFSQEISYHPNKYWTVKAEPVIKTSKVRFNYFKPQYGYPQRNLANKADHEEWEAWKEKNGFSYQYKLEGHSWQAVISNNKEVFQKHPEYLAEINGRRPGYGIARKLCVSNKNLQELFIKDRINAFIKLNNPEGAVSVEPSDGTGFCECVNCKKLGSISNQVFYLANLTAKRVKEKFPQGKVNLYAYNKHAQLPDFDLEPNVHVTVIPAGFQNLYDRDVMLNLWAGKAKLKTYYEYFAIPQQKGEQPRLYIQEYLERMKMAQNLGYQGFWFEAGVNINSAIGLVLFNQLWMDTTLTWDMVTERFLRSCFAGSYTPMKRLFERWWHTWLEDREIPAALYDLNEASGLAGSKDEKERINDLKAYVHYLAIYSEWNKNRKSIPATETFFKYLYQSSSRVVVNSPALYEVFRSQLSKPLQKKYNWRNKENRKSWVIHLAEPAINRNFEMDKKKYGTQKADFAFVPFKEGVQTVLKKAEPLKTFRIALKKMGDKIRAYSEGEINIRLLKPVDHNNSIDGKLLVSVMDSEGNLYYNDYILYSKPTLSLKLPDKKIYTISLLQYFSTEIEISGKIIPIINKSQMNQVKSKVSRKVGLKSNSNNEFEANYYFITE